MGLACAGITPAATPQFTADCAALTTNAHRLAGTPNGAAAAAYVQQRLEALGVDQVIVQEFPIAQLTVKRCAAVAADGNKTWPLLPMRPCGIVPPVTPPDGITGELVYAGAGSDAELGALNPQNKIVVLDYNNNFNWLRAFRLGAKAIIFAPNGVAESRNFNYARAQANLPRYYYNGPRQDLPDGTTITIHSDMAWERQTGRNVLGFIKGTDPQFDLGQPEVMIVSVPLDTYGEAPQATPGARAAANCAGLLKLAAYLKDHRPRRNMLLAFLDGEARALAGATALYGALEEDDNRATIATRKKTWQEETAFLATMLKLAESPDPLAGRTTDAGRELLNRMRSEAADRAYGVRAQLMDVREERAQAAKDSAAYQDLQRREAELKPVQNRWNELQRELGQARLSDASKDLFAEVLGAVKANIALRQRELQADEKTIATAQAVRELLGDQWITLHISLIMGNNTRRWGMVIGGDSEIHATDDKPGLYGRVQTSFLRAYRSLAEQGQAPADFEVASVDGSLRQTRLLWAAPILVHDGELAGRYGIYNIVLGTMLENLPREGTPDDTLGQLNIDVIEKNIDQVALILAAVSSQDNKLATREAVADQEGISIRRSIPVNAAYIMPGFANGRPSGALVMGRQRGSSIPNKPVPGAVVQVALTDPWNQCFWHHSKAFGFEPWHVVVTDQNGAYMVGGLPQNGAQPLGFALAFDAQGLPIMCSDMASRKTVTRRLNTFPCANGLLMMPPVKWPKDVTILDARANGSISGEQSDKSCVDTTDGVAWWYCDPKLKGVKAFGINSMVALVNDNLDPAKPQTALGTGYPLGTPWLTLLNTWQSAGDLWRLNESRISVLRERDIINSAMEEQHGRVQDTIKAAAATPSSVAREALATQAFMSGLPVYEQIRTSMDDLVKAVLVLLALCVPFAFAMERLLIGSSLIYKQVAWFAGFFVVTFVVLYLSHPAFAIANTPIIIFLGFAIVLLSVLVIVIIMQRFEVELKAMQGMTSTVHAADISRFNTVMAAMSMGISTMRRRPLRTALTAVTIVLLTFTILGFASFDTQRGIIKLFSAPAPLYTGVLLRNPTWSSFNPDFVDTVRCRFADQATVTPRYWICPEFADDPDFVVALEDGSTPVTLKGVLGISADELKFRPDLAEICKLAKPEEIEEVVLLTEAVAELLKVKPGDQVNLRGMRLRVGPLLNAADLSGAREMDGSSILPVDFAQMAAAQKSSTAEVTEDMLSEQDTWTSLPIDSIVITSARNARLLGGKPYLVGLYTADAQVAITVAEDLARMLDKTPIMATRLDGVYRHIQGTVVAASGIGDLFFPILLGGLVIFGTMLGSVADREREIYTFSALGLAPPHVASLFFAEALVYSVIGGLGGYLLAQGSMKILSVAARYGLVQLPEMNYSSTNAIVTILIVMATVLVSAIYPAIKASHSANPGLLRSWKLPLPKDDVIDLVFPFTVSAYDLTGVVSFLREHFDQFSDTGLGCFMARDSKLAKLADGNLGLSARLALAPFDLGVTQTLELRSAPSEIPGIDEVNIKITRMSGQPKDWARLNRILLDDLRKQFLLWRSLPRDTMEHYRQQTLTAMSV